MILPPLIFKRGASWNAKKFLAMIDQKIAARMKITGYQKGIAINYT
jgi:hypothetical protein